MMRMEEFKKYLESLEYIETQIVYLKYKYSWEENWTYSNEILEVDMNTDGYYVWASDWNEGQEDIEILGCIALYDIYVPKFQKDTEANRMSDLIDRQAAIEALERDEEYNEDIPNRADGVRDAIITISSLPSAESNERRGKWLNRRIVYMDVHMATCDQCGKRVVVGNFCPNCGADMRGEIR